VQSINANFLGKPSTGHSTLESPCLTELKTSLNHHHLPSRHAHATKQQLITLFKRESVGVAAGHLSLNPPGPNPPMSVATFQPVLSLKMDDSSARKRANITTDTDDNGPPIKKQATLTNGAGSNGGADVPKFGMANSSWQVDLEVSAFSIIGESDER